MKIYSWKRDPLPTTNYQKNMGEEVIEVITEYVKLRRE